VEIYEMLVSEAWDGRRLGELVSGDDCLAVALTRAGKAILPAADTVLEACDVLHVSATFAGVEALRTRLAAPKEA
jgi:Trk K+ transport system NAD-binding subunit